MRTNEIILVALLGIALGPLAGCATKTDRASQPATRLAPLKLFWDGRDNYTTAAQSGEYDALAKGYKFRRVEGFVFTRPQPGTTALKQYWSEARHDHWLLARDIPKNVEKNGAYQFVRVEGYVYTNAQPGTVALKYFSLMRGDNFTFTSPQAEQAARTGGYGQRKLFHAFVVPNGENSVRGIDAAATAVPAAPKKFSGATPLEWSQRLARSQMARETKPPKLDYTMGLFTLSLLKLNEVVPDAHGLDFTKEKIGGLISADGKVQGYRPEEFQLDSLNPMKTVLALWQLTGEERYKLAAQKLAAQLELQPRTFDGGFWHKQRYTNQMWLDGIYMADPFHAECGKLFGDAAAFDDVAKQIRLMDAHTYDAKTGLNYHGWDAAKIQPWANPVTGCSSNFWGRAEGWYAMALVDVLDYFPTNHPARGEIIATLQKLSVGVVKFQDAKTGLWWQVLDQGDRSGNYLEATASAMFVYALAKGVNHGCLPRDLVPAIERGYAGIIQNLIADDGGGKWSLTKCCSVAGLGGSPSNGKYRSGSFDYYIGEPVVDNDLKGIGPLILAGIEMSRLK
jgi:unsaturated rhamnogalacturonyl hydrolase